MTTRRRDFLANHLLKSLPLSRAPSTPSLSISIASVRFDLTTSDRKLADRLREYFSGYLATGPAQAELRLEPMTPPAECPELWEDEDAEFQVEQEQVIQRDFAAYRVARRESGGIERAFALVNGELDDSFHNCLRWFAPRVLLANRCFLLHAAGLIRDHEGYVFFGQSGAGKSTATGLITTSDSEAIPLGDDAVIIQADRQGAPLLHSAPLGCGYTRATPPALSAPLKGLFNLRQAPENRIERLAASQGVAALLASAMNTSAGEALESRFDLAAAFAGSACRIDALHFALSPTFWRLVLAEKSRSSSWRPHVHPAHQEKSRQIQVP
jgi:hypothetical protein